MKKYIMVAIASLLLMLTAGCGLLSKGKEKVEDATADGEEKQAEEKQAEAELGDYEVTFSGEVTEEDDQFIIDGESNLLPGSRIVGEIVVDDGETVFSDASELIEEDGSFHIELEHHQYGDAEIIVRFDFDNVQDDEILRHYGDKGQKLEGPFIYKHEVRSEVYQKAEVNLPYDTDGENNLTIETPEWMEIPEDYGDPRVWVEVDELTEDGEHLYLDGHSNLMEGSEIEVQYGNNRDKTNVRPDGSFSFTFDYEYLEDKEMLITFRPNMFQWNEIEEAYGKNGQNLVGNLAKKDRFDSSKQYVEKEVDWDPDEAELKSDDNNDESSDDEATADDDEAEDKDKQDDDKKEDSDDEEKDKE